MGRDTPVCRHCWLLLPGEEAQHYSHKQLIHNGLGSRARWRLESDHQVERVLR